MPALLTVFDQYLQSATFRKPILRISNEKPVVPFGTRELLNTKNTSLW